MGTSTSSAGAGSGASFDPPWLDDAETGIDSSHADKPISPNPAPEDGSDGANDSDSENDNTIPQHVESPAAAPAGRYQEARRALTGFVQSGSGSDLRRGISSFIKKGMGGSVKAASRMRTSAIASASLGGFLATVRDGTDPGIDAWVASVKQRNLSAHDTALEVVQKLLPTGGSIDEESVKHAMNQAISHLYEVDPTADIFNLADDQIANVMAFTVAYDVYNRVQLELGRVFEKLKYVPSVIQQRLAQVLDYIMVVVNKSMGKVRSGSTSHSMREIATSALQDALTVFSES
ncbi:Qat anti-phage system associated protein QatB [Pectobacterium sp. LFLA-215]|uniref:Qat anti-phage system associated protein QatB n=1 Tax=Pectobacterium sp. LFLA-215 TaxID=3419008 RepID=UPI003F5AE192